MATRRKYTAKDRAQAVGIALVDGQTSAAEQTGIPITTIHYWLEKPEFAELRTKTRADLSDGALAVAYLASAKLVERIQAGEIETRDLIVALGVAIDKAQLLSGQATSRTEHLDLTNSLDDHERATLRDLIEGALAEPAEAGAGGTPG